MAGAALGIIYISLTLKIAVVLNTLSSTSFITLSTPIPTILVTRLDALNFKISKSQRKALNKWNRFLIHGDEKGEFIA